MAWPTPQDYNEAIQSPKHNFDDPELKAGQAELTPLGLPKPITGGFASVYRIRCGTKSWAVRCFLRDFPDHQERYAAIGQHLGAANLPYAVGFHFLPKGLRIRGKWYPILKMEWIEGQSFAAVIQANVRSPLALSALADRWLEMVGGLQKHQIAHGDLQHGNIMIVGGDFRLIDYDGMYVPRLAGRGSHEVGHRNYQHPLRSEKHFGPYLDNFSSWTIYLTLLVLSVDPTFWGRYGNGDENLLFKREDFEEPRFSRVMRAIEQVKDDRVQRLMTQFRSFLAMDVTRIPSPVDALNPGKVVSTKKPVHRTIGDWWTGTKAEEKPVHAVSEPKVVALPIADAAQPQMPLQFSMPSLPERTSETYDDQLRFENSFVPERITLGAYALLLLAAAGTLWQGLATTLLAAKVSAGGGALALIFVLSRFLASKPLQEKIRMWSTVQLERTTAATLRLRMDYTGYRVAGNIRREEAKIKAQGLREQRLQEREKARIAAVEKDLQRILDEFKAQRSALQKAESEEIASRLGVLRDRHDELATFELSIATIPGFGPAMKKRLWDAGVRTAADFSSAHLDSASIELSDGRVIPIEGLGARKAAALAAWRRAIEARIQQGTPHALPPDEEKAVRSKFEFQQEAIGLQEKHATEIATARIELIKRRSQGAQHAVRARIQEIRVQFADPRQVLESELDERRRALLEQRKEVHAARRRFQRYRQIRFPQYLRRTLAL